MHGGQCNADEVLDNGECARNRNVGVVRRVAAVEAISYTRWLEFVPAGMRSARSFAQTHLHSDEGFLLDR